MVFRNNAEKVSQFENLSYQSINLSIYCPKMAIDIVVQMDSPCEKRDLLLAMLHLFVTPVDKIIIIVRKRQTADVLAGTVPRKWETTDGDVKPPNLQKYQN